MLKLLRAALGAALFACAVLQPPLAFAQQAGAFSPSGQATLSVSTTSARVALPSGDATALIQNTGTVTAYLTFGGSTVTSTTAGVPIFAGQSVAFSPGIRTHVAAVTASGTTALSVTTGVGVPTFANAGGGGGGGSGDATAAKQDEQTAKLTSIDSNLSTTVTGLPPGDPAAKASTSVSRGGVNISSATDTALLTATASQTGRLLDLLCTIDGAQTLTFKDGASTFTGGGPFRFPNGGVLQLPFVQHGYFETTTNTALNVTTTTSANVNCRFFFKKD